MRVLVTGGAGFIGTHIVDACLRAGHEVRVLDALLEHAHATRLPSFPDEVEMVVGDVRDESTVDSALSGVDAVCHQAAMVGRGRDIADAPVFAGCNDLGTGVLLAAMARRDVDRLVLASSVVIYGEGRYRCDTHGDVTPKPRDRADVAAGRYEPCCPLCGEPARHMVVDEDDRPQPRNVYGATKLAQEHLTQAWAACTGGSATILRYHHVYGPGMRLESAYSGVACTFRSIVQAKGTIQVFEDGRMRRDFIHVGDVADANVAVLAAPVPGCRTFNVATGVPRTIGEVAGTIAAIAGAPEPVLTGVSRFDDVRHIVASPRRINTELGWHARHDFTDGMRELVTEPMIRI